MSIIVRFEVRRSWFTCPSSPQRLWPAFCPTWEHIDGLMHILYRRLHVGEGSSRYMNHFLTSIMQLLGNVLFCFWCECRPLSGTWSWRSYGPGRHLWSTLDTVANHPGEQKRSSTPGHAYVLHTICVSRLATRSAVEEQEMTYQCDQM